MTQLTKSLRDKIVENAVSKATHEARLRRVELGQLFSYNLISFFNNNEEYGKALKIHNEIGKLTDEIPEMYRSGSYTYNPVNTSGLVYLNIGGMRYNLKIDTCVFPENDWDCCLVIPAGHELVNQFNELNEQSDKVQEIEDTVSATVSGVVRSVKTVKRLIEVWPESVELIPKDINKPASTLLTVRIQDLNTMIGIPSK